MQDTEIIDCGGKTILPGMCDAHCHPSIAASAYSGCDLFGIYIQDGESEEEVIDKYMTRLKKFVDENPGDEPHQRDRLGARKFPGGQEFQQGTISTGCAVTDRSYSNRSASTISG